MVPTGSNSPLRTIEPVSLRGQVFEEIQLAILESRLRPGDRIREHDLTTLLNVSRTPVREALVLLERDGLIVSVPNRGTFVRKFDESDIHEIYTMRTTLEDFAAELSLERLSDIHIEWLEKSMHSISEAIRQNNRPSIRILDLEFHRYLVSLAANSRLLNAWRVIAVQYTALSLYMEHTDFSSQTVIEDHQAIVNAYIGKDLTRIHSVNKSINERNAIFCIAGCKAWESSRDKDSS